MSLVYQYLKVLALLWLSMKMIEAWRAYQVIVSSINISSNHQHLDVQVNINNGTNGEQTIDARFDVKQQISSTIMYFNISATNTGHSATTMQFLERSFDFCKFLKERAVGNKDNLRLLLDDFKRKTTFLQECPIKPQVYKMEKFRFNEDHLPEFLPDAQYTFYFELMEEQQVKPFLFGTVIVALDSSKGMHALREFSIGS